MSLYDVNFNADKISVSDDRLLNVAVRMRSIYSKITKQIKEIENEVNNIGGYWESSNAQLLVELFGQEDVDSAVLNDVFTDQIDKLNDIINLYRDAENDNTETAFALPSGILS